LYFSLFTKWVDSGISIANLIDPTKTRVSEKQLSRYFQVFLDQKPLPERVSNPPSFKEINLKCDAKYFGRCGCTMVFKEGENIIFWHYALRENYFNYLFCFSKLNELGYIIKSVTSDKHGSLVSAVKVTFPNIPHQYCMVHLQKRCQTLLTENKRPKQA